MQPDTAEHGSQAGCIGVARLGSVQLPATVFSIWVQVRGTSWVEAREGRFQLRRGEWIALEKDSKPLLQADRYGVCVGLTLTAEALRTMTQFADCGLYAGRGRLSRRDARVALRLWREAGARAAGTDGIWDVTALRPILLHLAGIQREMSARIHKCPGRSRTRKRQVFGRLQRARLYLEGNCDRVVRISELAELTSFSSWYFSKTFHSLYEESPQAASARMRLERAADLLRDTSMMIGEVAAACGFDNCCSFARAFRSHHDMSATHYRRANARTDSAKPMAATRKASLRTGT
ncbi:MAG TPA: helix-turn-helix domain-containing protein [Lysobacter sp.]